MITLKEGLLNKRNIKDISDTYISPNIKRIDRAKNNKTTFNFTEFFEKELKQISKSSDLYLSGIIYEDTYTRFNFIYTVRPVIDILDNSKKITSDMKKFADTVLESCKKLNWFKRNGDSFLLRNMVNDSDYDDHLLSRSSAKTKYLKDALYNNIDKIVDQYAAWSRTHLDDKMLNSIWIELQFDSYTDNLERVDLYIVIDK